MLGSTVAAGFLFTILVWVDSHVWIYLRKRYFISLPLYNNVFKKWKTSYLELSILV